MDYCFSDKEDMLSHQIKETLGKHGPIIHEIKLNLDQVFEPKLSSKKLADGTMVTSKLEDMAPFISEERMIQIKKEASEI